MVYVVVVYVVTMGVRIMPFQISMYNLEREPASPCTSRSSSPVGINITEAGVRGMDQLWQVEQEQEEWVRPQCCCTYLLYLLL